MNSSWCLITQKKDGERVRQWLMRNSLLNRDFKIQLSEEGLIFPLVRKLKTHEIKNLTMQFGNISFKRFFMELKESKKSKDLFLALKELIPKNLHYFIPKSYDVIGKLVVIEIPDEIKSYEARIGEILLDFHPSLTSIFKKTKPIKGDFRLRDFQLIAGFNISETIHKENNCKYELDLKKVYFNPRLATEHNRVSLLVNPNEVILDMFAGIGPFSILIAKKKQVQVYAVDINPSAIYYLKKNAKLNKVENLVKPFEGNVREVLKKDIEQKFDRIIMNLPLNSFQFIDIALQVLKDDGIIHYYQFVSEFDFPVKILENLKDLIEENDRRIEKVMEIRKVRPYAPYIWQIGIDLQIK